MPWFEYDGPHDAKVTDRDTEMGLIRENMPAATSCHYDDVRKRVKRHERKEESVRLVNDFILCLEEMRGGEKGAPMWECARSDARDRLVDLCDLVDVPAEEVIGPDI